MHVACSGSFSDYTSLFANLKLMSVFFIHETLLVYKLETFTNWKEVKYIMIIVIAIIYIFLYYQIFDRQLKITLRKSSAPRPSGKSRTPISTHSPTKIQTLQVLPIFPNIESFSGPSWRKDGRR